MVDHSVINDVLVMLGLSVLAVAMMRRWNLPPILGYLLVGAIAGPGLLGWIPRNEVIDLLGEIGIVFLLFSIGLEFSLSQMMAMRNIVLGLGSVQVALTFAIVAAVSMIEGMSWEGALVIGGAFALSSTAIVIKQLSEQLELRSRHGRIAVGILLFQDIAVVPFLVAIPIIGEGTSDLLTPLMWALGKAVVAFVLMLGAGHLLLRPLLGWIAATRSVELFMLTVLFLALAAASVTAAFGLSLALGAFLAGMMIGETEFKHQIEVDIRSFKDIFLAIFFISVGALLEPALLAEYWPQILGIALTAMIGKFLLVTGLAKAAGNEFGVAMRSGIVLAQGGEFGFALFALGMSHSMLTMEETQIAVAAVFMTMMISPLLIRHNGAFAKRFCSTYLGHRHARGLEIESGAHELENHVVICGFGRIGQNLADFMKAQSIPYIALDIDPALIREAREAGSDVYYGDSSHKEILEFAHLERAAVCVLTYDDEHVQKATISSARRISSQVPVLVRTGNDASIERLVNAGATEVIPESIESSMMLATHVLETLDVPNDQVSELIERARANHYRGLRGYFHGEAQEEEELHDEHHLHTVMLGGDAFAVGMTLHQLAMESLAVTVNAVRRGVIRGDAPDGSLVLREGDILILEGSEKNLVRAEAYLLNG